MTAITVTDEHIAHGRPGNCQRCPVALAILDTFPDIRDVTVGPDDIFITGPYGNETVLNAPAVVVNFVWDFDESGAEAVGPFTFDLDYPEVTA